MLTIKKITNKDVSIKMIKELYFEAFPQEERIPFPLLTLRAKASWIEFLAFYDKEQFCGFLYLMKGKTITSIMYLAIPKALRSHGYGQAILTYLREEYPHHTLVLEIEKPQESSPNYLQQQRRKAFYFQNQFLETGYQVHMYQVEYEVLKSQPFFKASEWEQLTKRLSFGLMKFHLINKKDN